MLNWLTKLVRDLLDVVSGQLAICDWHHISVEGFKPVDLRTSSGSFAMLAAIRKLNPSFRDFPEYSVLRVQAFPRPVLVPALVFVSFPRRWTVSLQDVSSCHFGRRTNPRIRVQRGRSLSALPQDRHRQ